jgi:hypothetical protein
MANPKQKIMRRKMAQAVNYQLKAIAVLLDVRELFNEFHPEWDELFTAICNNCMITVGFIKELAVRAWGYFPEKLDSWLR